MRVDADDDSIRRYIVRLYAIDNTRRERRHQVVAAFDNEAEAMACFGRTHFDLLERSQSGRIDPREHVTIIVKEPGHATACACDVTSGTAYVGDLLGADARIVDARSNERSYLQVFRCEIDESRPAGRRDMQIVAHAPRHADRSAVKRRA